MEPDQIEKALQRLVPASMSEGGMASVDELIDELAGVESEAVKPRSNWLWWGSGVAASLAVLVGLAVETGRVEQIAANSVAGPALVEQGMVLLEQSDWVSAAEEDKVLMTENDGSVHRAWHVQVVNEERFRDRETGYEVRVVHPRSELVLMPVTAF